MVAYCIVNRNYRIEYLKGRKKREKSKYNHLCWIFYWTLLKKNAFKEKKQKTPDNFRLYIHNIEYIED